VRIRTLAVRFVARSRSTPLLSRAPIPSSPRSADRCPPPRASALALEAGDIDLERGELQLRTTKGNVRTSVPLSRAICDHLRGYLAGRANGLLFPVSSRHAQRRLEQWCRRAGIEHRVRPHDLRHSFAIRIYRKTRDLLLVQAALRHRSIASTTVYARTDDAAVRAAVGG
jgi:integrase